jgi:UDP-N-acetylglucosamine 4-epimerase
MHMQPRQDWKHLLDGRSFRWVVTGGAGFIGSHLVEELLRADQDVILIDNFATGKRSNIDDVCRSVGESKSKRLFIHEVDIRDQAKMVKLIEGTDYVLHQAALGSVPRSIKDPLTSHDVNVNGFISVLEAARAAKVKRFIYASSSSVYGDHPTLPKVEENIGNPLSPYAATKRANEIYARAYAAAYGMTIVGLRYFNVFGPRQDPDGQYAAVIPRWVKGILTNSEVAIFGDGETSRDFCYVKNAVQANLNAALAATLPESKATELNIAANHQTTLNQLYTSIRDGLAKISEDPKITRQKPLYKDFRPGDVRHSLADIAKAKALIDYSPTHSVSDGLAEALPWYGSSLNQAL